MNLKRAILKLIRNSGFDVIRLNEESPVWRRKRLMQNTGINLILDVGANIGEFAQTMRAYGYAGRIVSFEPLADAFRSYNRILCTALK